MKKIVLALVLLSVLISGCATSHVATKIGQNIADSFENSAKLGLVSADKIITSWPYVSGLLRGVASSDFERKVPYEVQETMQELDEIVAQSTHTNEDKGKLIGGVVRLEAKGAKFYWEEYGISLYKWFKVFISGA